MSTLIFLHLPKTAGTSLINLLQRNYDEAVSFNVSPGAQSLAEFAALDIETRRRLRLVYGHMLFGVDRYLPQAATYAVVLRHPLTRLMSAYRYYVQYPESFLHDYITDSGLSFKEYLLAGVDQTVDNLQTRLLSGDPEIYASRQFMGSVDDAMYDQARRNLGGNNVLVGVQEDFDSFVGRLARRFGFRDTRYGRLNATSAGEDFSAIDAETLAAVYQTNRHDFALYEFAREIADRQARLERLTAEQDA